jgi:hypothetical protein
MQTLCLLYSGSAADLDFLYIKLPTLNARNCALEAAGSKQFVCSISKRI